VNGVVSNAIVVNNKFGSRDDRCRRGYGVVDRDVGGFR